MHTTTSISGGISFFSPRKGFVCDNVHNYELVLANGTIINVNQAQHPDLLKALRGGSNNFGIVTRFDLNTFLQGSVWGGDIVYDVSTTPQNLQAFVNFGSNTDYDEYAALFQAYSFAGGNYSVLNSPIYTKPVVNPPAFQPFTAIQSQFGNSLRIDTLRSFTNVTSSAAATGLR